MQWLLLHKKKLQQEKRMLLKQREVRTVTLRVRIKRPTMKGLTVPVQKKFLPERLQRR